MAETWPSSLQQTLNAARFTYNFGETVLRSDLDVGPAKVRRRFTRPVDKVSAQIYLDYSDWSTFYTFFNTTLAGGSKTFNFTHPITNTLAEFRMTGPPRVTPVGGIVFQIDMEWELIP